MNICNITINCFNRRELFCKKDFAQIIITVNAESIVKSQNDAVLRRIISNGISTIDGQVPLWLFKLKYPQQKIEKLSGSDIIYDYCNWAESNQLKIFLLGGNEESNALAVDKLRQKYCSLQIEGYSPLYEPYPFSETTNKAILEKISRFQPDILFVGFGMGKQEYWESDNYNFLNKLGVKYIIGCGGTFDFVSGKIKRAPLFIQKIGFEGVWRLFMEPKLFRLKRIITSMRIFYYYIRYDLIK